MSRKDLIPLSKRSPEEKKRICAMGAKAANESMKRKKEVAETLKKVLLEVDPKSGHSYLEIISKQCGINTAKKGTLKDLKALAEIWGELTQDINVHADAIPVVDLNVVGGDDE